MRPIPRKPGHFGFFCTWYHLCEKIPKCRYSEVAKFIIKEHRHVGTTWSDKWILGVGVVGEKVIWVRSVPVAFCPFCGDKLDRATSPWSGYDPEKGDPSRGVGTHEVDGYPEGDDELDLGCGFNRPIIR